MKEIASGIYAILNLRNGKRYIGSAANLEGRRRRHFSVLKKGNHHNVYLQRAFLKYGGDIFGWEVLEYVKDLEKLISWEDLYLKIYWPTGLLYNSSPTAGSTLGFHFSELSRLKCSEAALQHWADPEQHQRMLNANPILRASGEQHPMFGKCHTAETRQAMVEAASKRWADPEQHQKASDSHRGKGCGEQNSMYGKHHTTEAKQKMSEAHMGKRNHMYGKSRSPETKHKISNTLKLWWAKHKRDQVAAQGEL